LEAVQSRRRNRRKVTSGVDRAAPCLSLDLDQSAVKARSSSSEGGCP
jgi:hypothetical protein